MRSEVILNRNECCIHRRSRVCAGDVYGTNRNLLYVLMKANAAQWSLLLMTLLMKTQKAALIAEARPDIWKQLKEDIVKNKEYVLSATGDV